MAPTKLDRRKFLLAGSAGIAGAQPHRRSPDKPKSGESIAKPPRAFPCEPLCPLWWRICLTTVGIYIQRGSSRSVR